MKLHLDSNIIEGTPEELVEYLRLVGEEEKKSGSTELQVGDKVKVLVSEGGAEGEATVTAVLENDKVELEGKNRNGRYLTDWVNHVSNLEKVEEDEDLDPEEEDELLGYRYWYLEGSNFNEFVVLKAKPSYLVDSTDKRYTYQAVSGYLKPITRRDARVKFVDAENRGALLKYYPKPDIFSSNY